MFFFQFVESRIKLLIGWARRWYAYEWLSHGHLMAQFDFILLCCFWFFTKELCIIIKIKVRECSFKNQFTACHYKLGLVCFLLLHFSLRVQLFFKRKKLQCYSWWSGIILILEGVFLCTCIFTRYVSSFASSGKCKDFLYLNISWSLRYNYSNDHTASAKNPLLLDHVWNRKVHSE